MQLVLTPPLILEAYRQGVFPMAYNAGSPFIHWICPEMRGQLPIKTLHVGKRLRQTLKRRPYEVTVDQAFEEVVKGCAEPGLKRPETWINPAIMKVFCELHEEGHAHSVECWHEGRLVGGIYGLKIGGAFFGESMFSRARDASKIALVHLTARLWKGGFKLFDTQFVNDHLKQFGVYELPFADYKRALGEALKAKADFKLEGMAEEELVLDYIRNRQ